ncbi:Photosystem II manganese-stabilizing polypeptide [Leptolyngbyaceae cyanobacterium CCMR0082]|uniref:Photosystem II extrinsic protein O n=2 Tax=Adonisia turfae TaxID=2950184 RepID=A0A6M0S2L3_9CYAN|nr:photosystem II manganese-stabilizing polypeptide [Adonisia turfae]MDV3347531.1 photosystem II manganese-stabilizing polypeptide [Leptothoe sp. LEGE 181152]NEZ59317.1 Photosystem II manganese-stabilizing polypeptide [Adonisia turfae CCMR0081]NEZ62211.1 Photosystem II manganese-stabilizing polypeptide [Adonisia turfae CCMR0082]
MRYRALIVAFLALCMGVLTACSDAPSADSNTPLTYDQIRNTGLANSCPQISSVRRGEIAIDSGKSYQIAGLCLEPTSYFVKEEPANKRREAEFISGKSLTRYTSSLDQVRGSLELNPDGSLLFTEIDGIDFQAVTVLLPGGEEVPFLFTIKGLVAQSQAGLNAITSSTDFIGDYRVPSYRTSNFLDPKGRGLTTGYDTAVALPAGGDTEELIKENMKAFKVGQGTMSLQVEKVDSVTGEIAGTFECEQPSDTDMGTAEPSDVRVQGLFYGRVEAT